MNYVQARLTDRDTKQNQVFCVTDLRERMLKQSGKTKQAAFKGDVLCNSDQSDKILFSLDEV